QPSRSRHTDDCNRRSLSSHAAAVVATVGHAIEGRTAMSGWLMAGRHPGDYDYEFVANAYQAKPAARMWRKTATTEGFGTLMQMFEADRYRGKRMRFSGLVRTKDVAEWAGLWMRVDGPAKAPLAFYNMEDRKIVGTTDWSRFDVVLDVDADAMAVAFGLLLGGPGEAWLSEVQFEAVGADVPVSVFEGEDAPADSYKLPAEPANLDFSQRRSD